MMNVTSSWLREKANEYDAEEERMLQAKRDEDARQCELQAAALRRQADYEEKKENRR